jgi:2-polyprenyl-3-methyl-5-hydroxy-6-metoxy-1,4-benzoquinol methylase
MVDVSKLAKWIGLKIPSLRRLHTERNRYAAQLEVLRREESELVAGNIAAIQRRIATLALRLPAYDRALFLDAEAERAREAAYSPNPYDCEAFDYNWFKYASVVQSTLFYAELLPLLTEWLLRQPRGSTFRLLDVGSSTGAGAELLARIFWTHFTGYRIHVDAIDVESTYERLSPLFNPHIFYRVQDVFALAANTYDICICTHTIEHMATG